MAEGLGVTLRGLEVFFQDRFGLGPHDWMVRARMIHAAGLLIKGMAVKIVGTQVGYKQVSHFSREFKLFFGVSPRRYVCRGRATELQNFGRFRI
jgi:transcriptional regulator GlxA family with amidase domain